MTTTTMMAPAALDALNRRVDTADYNVRRSLVKMRIALENDLGVSGSDLEEYCERVAVLRALVADLEQVGSEQSDLPVLSESKGQQLV